MSKKGHYQKAKPAGGGWKKALLVVAIIVLILAILAAGAYLFLDSKLNKITQAQREDKGTTAELDAMAAGGTDITAPTELDATEAPVENPEIETQPEEVLPVENTETEPTTEEPTEPETTEPETTEPVILNDKDYGESGKIINIMVIGQDSRPEEGHKLADTIMLFTLNKEKRTLTATSFLRDSYINLPDYYRGHTCGWNRINTAYALGYGWFGDEGAMDMLNVTIKNNFGIDIDGDVEVSLITFETIVDIMGGVDLDLQGDELVYMNNVVDVYVETFGDMFDLHHFVEGENHLTGMEALWYARMRHANAADSDMNRAARQRLIIEKILGNLKKMSLLELNSMLDEVLPLIVTNISTDDMKMYIKECLPYIFDVELVSNQCPAEGSYWGEWVELPDGPGTVLKMDFAKNSAILKEICTDGE